MAIIDEENVLTSIVLDVVKRMVTAAVTAPKAKGIRNMYTAIITGSDIIPIAVKMEQMALEFDVPSFHRDAQNIKQCDAMVLLGTAIQSINLKKCGMCGFANCAEKNKHSTVPCVFNTGDLGIALGSAVSIAMDNRIDNRIMYTVGQAVKELDIFPENVSIIYAIPLKASSKNIFFDRG